METEVEIGKNSYEFFTKIVHQRGVDESDHESDDVYACHNFGVKVT